MRRYPLLIPALLLAQCAEAGEIVDVTTTTTAPQSEESTDDEEDELADEPKVPEEAPDSKPSLYDKGERPNILWLSFEDSSYWLLGCYGNEETTTPNIDELAKTGLQFTYAYSNGTQSSPARSTLITGCYATTYGMEQHRSSINTPSNIFYPQYMRAGGYYCTNNSKTDYNTNNAKGIWDNSSKSASYNNAERKDRPFFAVFNAGNTHMSRLLSYNLDGRDTRNLPAKGLYGDNLPGYLPSSNSWIKSDFAFHEEGINEIDIWVGRFVADLKAKGLFDDTIIFIYSDHGGCLPRGKGYAFESSLRVPMVVYIPPKWQEVIPADGSIEVGKASDRLVSFVDLAPTALSLMNEPIPAYMQGEAFLGPKAEAPREYIFGYSGNQDRYNPLRAVSDGKWKYIRRFIPFGQDNVIKSYQWPMPANVALDDAYYKGELTPEQSRIYDFQGPELLFNIEDDPYETRNLADDPASHTELTRLRHELKKHMRESGDLGIYVPSIRNDKQPNVYSYTKAHPEVFNEILMLAELNATVTKEDIPMLTKSITSDEVSTRFWAAIAFGELARKGGLDKAPEELKDFMYSTDAGNLYAIYALYHSNNGGDKAAAITRMKNHLDDCWPVLEILSFEPEAKADVLSMRGAIEARIAKYPGSNGSARLRRYLANVGIGGHLDIFDGKSARSVNTKKHAITPLP